MLYDFHGNVFIVFICSSPKVIVQRTLGAKNISPAKGGCVLAAYLKLLPLFVLVIPGMAARVIWPNWVGKKEEKEKVHCLLFAVLFLLLLGRMLQP